MKMNSPNPMERFPALKQLLEALRRETERLGPQDDSALTFDPAKAPEE